MPRPSILIAALAALAVAPVQAASFASASLTDFKITLFDLNPTDGITPGITFPTPYLDDAAVVNAQDDRNSRERVVTGTGPFDLNAATARSSARAAVSGTGPFNVTSLTASGSALGTPAPGGFSAYGTSAFSPSDSEFIVTAKTQVSFSALAKVEATTTIGSDRFGDESAIAAAELLVFGVDPGGGSGQFSSDHLEVFFAEGSQAGSRGTAGPLTVSFANVTGGDLGGELSRRVFASGFSSAVPEPETYAMMVAGLGLLGFMLRRRRGRSASDGSTRP